MHGLTGEGLTLRAARRAEPLRSCQSASLACEPELGDVGAGSAAQVVLRKAEIPTLASTPMMSFDVFGDAIGSADRKLGCAKES
jgi:hypothetical protein